MKSYILGTSVAVSWYLQESFSISARKWLERLCSQEIELYVPSLHYLEFGNVLRSYVKRGELGERLAQEIYSTHLDSGIQILEPERQTLLAIAIEFDATVYDAAYIAIAKSLDAPVITAERETTNWVKKLGGLAVSV